MRLLSVAIAVPGVKYIFKAYQRSKSKPITVAGLRFPNRVGLAAGFDKNGVYISELGMLGFGHIEAGTVTPLAQPGNDKPRLFRLLDDKALLNRMGFNNHGADSMAESLEKARRKNPDIIIGANIGKNKVTANEDAVKDYITCFKKLYPYCDYFTVNVSSPNTPGLRELQDKGPLLNILNELSGLRDIYTGEGQPRRPIFLKIAPDLETAQLDDIVSIVLQSGIEGVVCTNTTISREGLLTPGVNELGAGGISGKPLRKRSTEVIRYIAQRAQKKFVIIGAGGIHSADDAKEKIQAGADLVQVYTGFIYEGPALVRKINRAL